MSTVHLHGKLSRAEALAALFNAAKPQGLGNLQYNASHVMNELEAEMILAKGEYVDYLEGRVIKVDFKNPKEIDTTLYDRDNGKDAGEAAVFFARYRHLAQNGATGFLPFKVMGHKAVQTDIVGVTGFRYDDVMGGTLIVYMRPEVMQLQSRIHFEFHHTDLGREYMQIITSTESIAKRKEEFGYCIERVIIQAMRRMLEKDKE